jgi:DNA topoisomerase-1
VRTSKATRDIPKAQEEAYAEVAEGICDNCGKQVAIKNGRFGQFLACTGYPGCKSTRKIQKGGKFAAPDIVVEEACPHCAERLLLKHGRYGAFTACSNYPKCRYVKQETTGVSCPECGTGELVSKKSTRGAFYACSSYPTCKFTLRNKPIPQSCPQCGARFLVEHTVKHGGRELQCRTEGCKFEKALPDVINGEPEKRDSGPGPGRTQFFDKRGVTN